MLYYFAHLTRVFQMEYVMFFDHSGGHMYLRAKKKKRKKKKEKKTATSTQWRVLQFGPLPWNLHSTLL